MNDYLLILLIMGLVVREQLRVQPVTSSVRQEVVSMVTVSVTLCSIVLTRLMKQIVVSLMINTGSMTS